MNNIARAGWICACLGLMAPASTFAESVGVMHGAYEASLVRFTPAPDEAAAQAPSVESLFSLCRRCNAPAASPFLVSNALSPVLSGRDGGFSELFGGMLTLPLPGLNAGAAWLSGASVSSGASMTMPFPAETDDHHSAGGSTAAPSHSSSVAGGLTHGGSIAGGALPTTRAALSKATSLAATPEPASLVLLGIGLIGVASRRAWRAVS